MPHTPGPWFHNATPRSGARAVWNSNGSALTDEEAARERMICACPEGRSFPDWQPTADEVDANMRLIAAAPDLLAACKRVLEMLTIPAAEYVPAIGDCFPILEAAIAKTTAPSGSEITARANRPA